MRCIEEGFRMKEAKLTYKAYDGKNIFCPVTYANSETLRSDKAIILVHGLTGYPYVHVLQVLSRFFSAKGYDVYRPALYWSGDGNRTLSECATSTHTRDIQAVVDELRQIYKKLYVVGHSMAGTSMINLNHDADAYCFLDCDYSPWDDTWANARYNEKIDAYFIGWGTESLVSKKMVEEAKNTSIKQIDNLIQKINIPSQVITAEFGQVEAGERIFASLLCQKEYKLIENAGHTFVDNDSSERLTKFIFDWFERF
jgi:esterase/lipase